MIHKQTHTYLVDQSLWVSQSCIRTSSKMCAKLIHIQAHIITHVPCTYMTKCITGITPNQLKIDRSLYQLGDRSPILMATSDYLPVIQILKKGTEDSCFALIWAPQCGTPYTSFGWLSSSYHSDTQVNTCGLHDKRGRGRLTVKAWLCALMVG